MIGRIPILDVSPVVAAGAWPAKAAVGETLEVAATIFREGHDGLGADVVLKGPDGKARPFNRLRQVGFAGLDRWATDIFLDAPGMWTFRVEAWSDPIGTWQHDAAIKIPLGQDVDLVCEAGAQLHERVKGGAKGQKALLAAAVAALRDDSLEPAERIAPAFTQDVLDVVAASPIRELVTKSATYQLNVERELARFSAWYEFFPRSEGARQLEDGSWQSGTFSTSAKRLPAVAAMGFDIVYLPPIHPIGVAFRKGANNTLDPGPNDPGSPWAIGGIDGGHDAIHPELGTIADFDDFVTTATEQGLQVALDLALQCSPDHPWVSEHPDWFTHRTDGSIAYAENPPKKYQDIYPINFDNDPKGLSAEVLRVVRHWMDHGVRIFRVDNPHTKPVWFWEWLIGEVAKTDPDVIWLAEAFTKPAMMRSLATVGFTQSYSYFTWRTERWNLEEYLTELSQDTVNVLRPNFFVNTPDILHAYLQYGGPAAFHIRAVLASMMSPAWGVYSGYELFEHIAVAPGSEEYLDSEKYSFRPRDWAAAESAGHTLVPLITNLNRIRQEHPSLRHLRNLRWHGPDNDQVIAWSKRWIDPTTGIEDTVLCIVNLDPHATRESTIHLDLDALGLNADDRFDVTDLLTGATYEWGNANYVRLDPWSQPAHVFAVHSRGRG